MLVPWFEAASEDQRVRHSGNEPALLNTIQKLTRASRVKGRCWVALPRHRRSRRRIAVFPAGETPELAETIAGQDPERWLTASIVDAGLITTSAVIEPSTRLYFERGGECLAVRAPDHRGRFRRRREWRVQHDPGEGLRCGRARPPWSPHRRGSRTPAAPEPFRGPHEHEHQAGVGGRHEGVPGVSTPACPCASAALRTRARGRCPKRHPAAVALDQRTVAW